MSLLDSILLQGLLPRAFGGQLGSQPAPMQVAARRAAMPSYIPPQGGQVIQPRQPTQLDAPQIASPQSYGPGPALSSQQGQQAMPPQMGAQGGGMGAFLASMRNNEGLIPAIIGAAGGPTPYNQQIEQQRAMYQALVQNGMPPQRAMLAVMNPDAYKLAYPEHKWSSGGKGYIFDDRSGESKKLYDEDDDRLPGGYQWNSSDDHSKGVHPMTGGPADPEVLKRNAAIEGGKTQFNVPLHGAVMANERDEQGNPVLNEDGTPKIKEIYRNEGEPLEMTPEAVEMAARREIGGDYTHRTNLGTGAQKSKAITAIINRETDILTKDYGLTPQQAAEHMSNAFQQWHAQGIGLSAEARTSAVREANLNLILKAANAAIPAALEASENVARTGWTPLNKVIQKGEVIASDPALKKFGMANLQLAEHWARAMNPTGVMRESDRDKALEFLSTADSKDTYRQAVSQLYTQIQRERDAVQKTRGMTGLPGANNNDTPAPGANPAPAGTGTIPPGWAVRTD